MKLNGNGENINITTLNQSVFKVTFSSILLCALVATCFYALLLLYTWPLKIEVDEEKDLKFYYPFTPSYWCGKADEEINNQVDEEVGLMNPSHRISDNQTSLQEQE